MTADTRVREETVRNPVQLPKTHTRPQRPRAQSSARTSRAALNADFLFVCPYAASLAKDITVFVR